MGIEASAENAARVIRALGRFGAPLAGISPDDFQLPNVVFQVGVAPRRIDVLMSIDGVSFDEAYPNRLTLRIEGLEVPVIGRAELLRNKRATGRTKDLADAESLES